MWSDTYLAINAAALVETGEGPREGTVYSWNDDRTQVTVMWPSRRLETFSREQVKVRW